MRFFGKTTDEEILHEILGRFEKIITVEDGTVVGGFVPESSEFMNENTITKQK